MSSGSPTATPSSGDGDGDSLLKQREVDQELRDVDHVLQAEVILTPEEGVGAFGLEGDLEDLVTEGQGV